MAIYTIGTSVIETADAIVSGDKTFQRVAPDFGASIGDFIHFHYVLRGTVLQHSVSDQLYLVTHIEDVSDTLSIIGFKQAVSWIGHVKRSIKTAKKYNDTCVIGFYGSGGYGQYKVKEHNDCGVILVNDNHVEVHRDYGCISGIQLLRNEVIL